MRDATFYTYEASCAIQSTVCVKLFCAALTCLFFAIVHYDIVGPHNDTSLIPYDIWPFSCEVFQWATISNKMRTKTSDLNGRTSLWIKNKWYLMCVNYLKKNAFFSIDFWSVRDMCSYALKLRKVMKTEHAVLIICKWWYSNLIWYFF